MACSISKYFRDVTSPLVNTHAAILSGNRSRLAYPSGTLGTSDHEFLYEEIKGWSFICPKAQ